MYFAFLPHYAVVYDTLCITITYICVFIGVLWGLLVLGCTYLFLLAYIVLIYIKRSPLRSSDQSSVLFHCACFVPFWLAVSSHVALVHKPEQPIMTKALHALL